MNQKASHNDDFVSTKFFQVNQNSDTKKNLKHQFKLKIKLIFHLVKYREFQQHLKVRFEISRRYWYRDFVLHSLEAGDSLFLEITEVHPSRMNPTQASYIHV